MLEATPVPLGDVNEFADIVRMKVYLCKDSTYIITKFTVITELPVQLDSFHDMGSTFPSLSTASPEAVCTSQQYV